MNFNILLVARTDGVRGAIDRQKPAVGQYVGGMGRENKNFHKEMMAWRGFPEAAERIQAFSLAGRRDEAIAAVSDDYIDQGALIDPLARIRSCLDGWLDSGVAGLTLHGADAAGCRLRQLIDYQGAYVAQVSRVARIAPDLNQINQRSVHRAAEIMGARTAMRAGSELMALTINPPAIGEGTARPGTRKHEKGNRGEPMVAGVTPPTALIRRGDAMGYSLQELADKLAIQELIFDYSDAIDRKNFDRLDDIFLPDAVIDYTAMGGPRGSYPEIRQFLQGALSHFNEYYHLNANVRTWLDGDQATGRVMCFNPMGVPVPEGSNQMMFLGLFYDDKYVRTDKGWRFSERTEVRSWGYNVPKFMNTGG